MLLLNTSDSTCCITLWNLAQVRLSGKQTLKRAGMQEVYWERLLGSPHVDEKERKQDWEEQKFGLWCNLSEGLGQTFRSWGSASVLSHLGQGDWVITLCKDRNWMQVASGRAFDLGCGRGCTSIQQRQFPSRDESWVLSVMNTHCNLGK